MSDLDNPEVRRALATFMTTAADIREEAKHVPALVEARDGMEAAAARYIEAAEKAQRLRSRMETARATVQDVERLRLDRDDAAKAAAEKRALLIAEAGSEADAKAAAAALAEIEAALAKATDAAADDLALLEHGKAPLAEAERMERQAEADLNAGAAQYFAERAAWSKMRATLAYAWRVAPYQSEYLACFRAAEALLGAQLHGYRDAWRIEREGDLHPTSRETVAQRAGELANAMRKACGLPSGWRATPGNF